jgi:hypothetical protein
MPMSMSVPTIPAQVGLVAGRYVNIGPVTRPIRLG